MLIGLIGNRTWLAGLAALVSGAFASVASADKLQVTITNIAGGQSFTPIMVVSHRASVRLFTLGQPATQGLARLAEAGDNSQIEATLRGDPDVLDVSDSGAVLAPGKSVTLTVRTRRDFDHLSVAAMLIPTNDAFFAINDASVASLRGQDDEDARGQVVTLFAPAYDAGTKADDELCANIPGPPTVCRGSGFVPEITGPNFVFIHGGIHGIGDLQPSRFDWRNPVARITVTRIADSQ